MDTTVLLSAWEEGAARSSLDRALLLLTAAQPEVSRDAWASLPIGQRDAWLLSLRERWFGSRLEAVTACPLCDERLELAMNVNDVRLPSPTGETTLCLETEGRVVRFRVPNSHDLAAVISQGLGRDDLLRRCLETDDDLPAPVLDEIERRMEAADPQAVIEIALRCPNCEHPWTSRFDIVAYLWSEVESWAIRQFREVHALATAYGWSEREILSLTPRRRRTYLDLVGA